MEATHKYKSTESGQELTAAETGEGRNTSGTYGLNLPSDVHVRLKALESLKLRGLWFREDRYQPLRNAAWLVRNTRRGQANNPMALAVVVGETGRLLQDGEPMPDVIEALCELLIHP